MSLIPPHPDMERRVRRARRVLVWETVWPRLVPPVFLAILIVGLTLSGGFEILPAGGHIMLLSILAVGMLIALVAPWRQVRFPGRSDVLRRLEVENGLTNNPLQSFEDHISETNDPLTNYLWQKQQGLNEESLRNLRLPRPAPALSRIDRFGLTAFPVLMLFIGLMVGHDQITERFSKAFSPLQRLGTADFSATLWVTPPSYTGQVPRVLRFNTPGPNARPITGQADNTQSSQNANNAVLSVQVPQGSTLDGSISSVWKPSLTGPAGDVDLTESAVDSYVLSTALTQSGRWDISVWGNERLAIDVQIVADQPPRLQFVSAPSPTRRNHLRLDYVATDDYGMSELDLVITPAPQDGDIGQYGPFERIVIGLKGEDAPENSMPTRIEGPRFLDLVAHPWAGLPVNMQLVSTDNAGQMGQSDLRATILPEREFTHPVAQKLIAIRRALLRQPIRALEMHQALLPVLYSPQSFNGHLGVFLTLSVAEKRLSQHLANRDVHQDVASLLWYSAEEIERGSFGIAERNLMEAEERLLDALADPNVTETEIARLIEEYRQALNEYLAALTRETPQQDEETPQMGATLEQQDLSRILEQIDALTRAGARDQARELINRLRELVENMQVTTGPSTMSITSALREMLDGMRDLSRRQQELMRQGDGSESGSNGASSPGQRAGQQQNLANDAQDILNQEGLGSFGSASGMNDVIDAMQRATRALRGGRSHEALQSQQDAMQALQQGIGEINRALEGLSQLSPMLDDMDGTGRRDPLGRPVGGDGTTTIPDTDTLERAWHILQELRRRSSDPERPQIEQDYIDRLLKRF
ncbi:DUF4175 domain-containing protein [Thalassospira sp. MA62]|nr:DUF4175 domain-containing protein [Thalassospira sp. MA62]